MCRKQTFSPSMEQHLSASPSPMVMELLGKVATGNWVLPGKWAGTGSSDRGTFYKEGSCLDIFVVSTDLLPCVY